MAFSGVFYLLHTLIKQIRQSASACQNRASLRFYGRNFPNFCWNFQTRIFFENFVYGTFLDTMKSASIIQKRTQFKLNIKFIKRFTDVNYRPNSFFRSFQLLPRSTLAFFPSKGRGLSLTTHRGTLLLFRFPTNLIFSASAGPNISAIDILQAWKVCSDSGSLQKLTR